LSPSGLVADRPDNAPHHPHLAAGTPGAEFGAASQRQFPEQSQIIIDRYRVYQAQERAITQAALKAASCDTQQPPLLPLQVARQLGYENKWYLQTYFPLLGHHRLFQRYEDHRRQVAPGDLTLVFSWRGQSATYSSGLASRAKRVGVIHLTGERKSKDGSLIFVSQIST
jgi:hypothetical protein